MFIFPRQFGASLLTEIISEDILSNINLVYFIEDYGYSDYITHNQSALVRSCSDKPWVHFSVFNKEDLLELLNFLTDSDIYFASVENWILPYLSELGNFDFSLDCMQYYLPEDHKISAPSIKLNNLNQEHIETILQYSHYKEFLSYDYVLDRIFKGPSSAYLYEGELAGWALTHDDGGIGFLQVLPDYQRKGIAANIMLDMMNKVRKRGRIPFAYIELNNQKSRNLLKKLGFAEQKEIAWVKLNRF